MKFRFLRKRSATPKSGEATDSAPGADAPGADRAARATSSAKPDVSSKPDEAAVRAVLEQVWDPELGIDIVNLGLVREIESSDGALRVAITATSPSCPAGEWLRSQAEEALANAFRGVSVHVELNWEPPWRPEDMSELARRQLGYF